MARVLVIDDHDSMREGMAITLTKDGHEVAAVRSAIDGLAAYRKARFDLVVSDLKMEAMDGIELVEKLRAHDPDAVVMVVTAFGSIETAVTAMQKGAWDFLPKPFSNDVLRAKAARALEHGATRRQLARVTGVSEALSRDAALQKGAFVGESEAVQRLLSQVKKAAQSDVTVLIHGESGTGKELIARRIHEQSQRSAGPFITVHCAAIPETLLESELFGHERGAFTGAVKRKLGRFELADGGTLLLDEIGELSPSVQTKLLRVLQEREIQRLGSEETVKIDVRVVTATHRDLKAEVAAGRFREDLFFRLHIVPLKLPPLRERPEDIAVLARHFIARSAPKMNPRVKGLTDAALEALRRHRWPGNVRELENAIEQSLVFAEGDALDAADLPESVRGPSSSGGLVLPEGNRPLPEVLEELERQLIQRAYEKAGKVKTETARLLGIKTSALYYKLEKYGFIQKGEAPPGDA